MVDNNTQQLCRVCLKKSYLYSNIFSEQLDDGSHFVDVINDLLQLDMEFEDGFPEFLCSECYNKISEFEIFKRTAHEGRAVLLYSNGWMENTDAVLEGEPAGAGVFVPVQTEVYLVPMEIQEDDSIAVERDPLEIETVDTFRIDGCASRHGHERNLKVFTSPVHLAISRDLKESNRVVNSHGAQATQMDVLQINKGKKNNLCDKEFYRSHHTVNQSFDAGVKPYDCILTKNVISCRKDLVKQETCVLSGENPLECNLSGKIVSGSEQLSSYGQVSKTCENPAEGKLHETAFSESNSAKKNDKLRCMLCKNGCNSNCIMKTSESVEKTSETLLTCRYCYKSYPYKYVLRRHERIHTGERPFECTYCNKSFIDKGTLKIHERTHTGEKPFECKFCNKRFSDRSSLKSHERVHTGERPYMCNSCGKTFTHSSTKSAHERLHTGEKNLECAYCDKRFTHGNDLKKHERIHTGEKPFNCNVCGKAFSLSSSLRKHERLHERV